MLELWDWTNSDGGHYSKPVPCFRGMLALRTMFPDGEANSLSFILFSTSGVHGTHRTIEEDYEDWRDNRVSHGITFVVVQPRIVAMRYGNVMPDSEDDYEFLKRLRKSSHDVVARIGLTCEAIASEKFPSKGN